MSIDATYDLGELCDLADVTPRTVRYYLQQGLLPSPGRHGPGTRYDRGHLDRLLLIKRLQREHLPLAEIRRRLAALDDEAVRALVEREPPPPAAVHESSAIGYIRDLLSGARTQPAPAPRSMKRERSSHEAPAAESIMPYAAAPMLREESGPGSPGPSRSTWERIVLAPDVELHVRRPLTRAHGKLVDRLVAEARTLFDEER